MFHIFCSRLLDLFFPPRCVGCKQEGSFFCSSCQKQILPKQNPSDPHPPQGLDALSVVAGYHENPHLAKAIAQMKYRFTADLAKTFGELIAQNVPMGSEDLLVAVPLSMRRKWWRGFNQAEKIAEVIAQKTGAKLVAPLVRHRHTSAQAQLNRADRLTNLTNAFSLIPNFDLSLLQNRKVWLIDDVSSTGATLSECAKELRKAGVHSLCGAVIARG